MSPLSKVLRYGFENRHQQKLKIGNSIHVDKLILAVSKNSVPLNALNYRHNISVATWGGTTISDTSIWFRFLWSTKPALVGPWLQLVLGTERGQHLAQNDSHPTAQRSRATGILPIYQLTTDQDICLYHMYCIVIYIYIHYCYNMLLLYIYNVYIVI